MTYAQAIATLPSTARWSCSFGYPGEGGFREYFHGPRPDGRPGRRTYIIGNGQWFDLRPFRFSVAIIDQSE